MYFKNKLSGETLSKDEFAAFVREEAERQYEDCHEDSLWSDLSKEEQQAIVEDQYEHQLRDRDWSIVEMKAYRIAITETLVREVEVYAMDAVEAQEIVEELCNEGTIDLDFSDFSERETKCRGVAREIDLQLHDIYDRDGKRDRDDKASLDSKIQDAVKARGPEGERSPGMMPMPGTESPDWGKMHWGSEER